MIWRFSFILMAFCFACGQPKQTQQIAAIDPADTVDIKPDPANPNHQKLEFFLKRFEAAVLSHNPKRILEFMDVEYKTEQHDSLLKGNTTQFLNEFFSGTLYKGNEYIAANYKQITSIKKTDLELFEKNYKVKYLLVCNGKTIQVSWVLTVKWENQVLHYGLYGAVG